MPGFATAQRGSGTGPGTGGGTGGGGGPVGTRVKIDRGTKADYSDQEKRSTSGVKLSGRNVEDVSPIKLLIDKRKALKLSDDQTNQLKDLAGKLKRKNEPLLKVMDSLLKAARPGSATPSDEDVVRQALVLNDLDGVLKGIRANYAAALSEALPLLDATQQKAAQELLDKQTSDAAAMFREKLGVRPSDEDSGSGRERP